MSEHTRKALDLIRINGNNAVHPGEICIEEESIEDMYKILNMIVQELISNKKQINDMYKNLPESYKESIKRRENKK